MGVDHPGQGLSIQALMREVRRVAKATIQNASVGRAGIRVYDGGWIRIEGGGLSITGSAQVIGTLLGLNGSTLDWDGDAYFRRTLSVTAAADFASTMKIRGVTTISGATTISNTLDVTAETTLGGDVTLDNDLTVGTGRILVGPIVIDKNGAYGGRIASSSTLLLDAPNAGASGNFLASGDLSTLGSISALGDITAVGDVYGRTKNFLIDHPTKPGKQLRHGSLEGPEHGVYYRGVVEFDDAGEAVFELPDYFTALALEDDVPTVQVTPIGRPFLAGAERVEDGRVTIYGERNREAHVTVTAARGLFDVEPDKG